MRTDATTLTKRVKEATKPARRLRRLPLDYADKAKAIRAKILPMGLYECVCSRINEVAMRTFRAAVADCLTKLR